MSYRKKESGGWGGPLQPGLTWTGGLGRMDGIAISIKNVSKKYNIYQQPIHRLKEYLSFGRRSYHQEFWALENISFDVRKGETLGIIGKNGSGKSTLLQIISGILQPTSGNLHTHGRVSAILELGAGFNPEFTGRENVLMNGQIMGLAPAEIEGRFEGIAAFADIGDFIDQPVKTYSSGMYVRLAFAISINVDPDILVIDEALAVGDIFFRQKCYRKLEDFRKRGVAILLVSHSMPEVLQFCERTLLLNQGHMEFEGATATAVRKYYMIQQAGREEEFVNAPGQGVSEGQDTPPPAERQVSNGHRFWPGPQGHLDLSGGLEVSNGWARLTAVALCNLNGESCRVFQQGEPAVFFYEFELLHDIEVPIAGIAIYNERNVIVHGKTSLEYGTEVPSFVKKGNCLRIRHEISLELGIGEYTFHVGLSTMKNEDFMYRSSFIHPELAGRILRLCHLPVPGSFSVVFRKEANPVQLLHHGLCNLPGSCDIRVFSSDSDKDPRGEE